MLKDRPPRLGEWFLRRFLLADECHEKLGDFEEGYHLKVIEKGKHKAFVWYWLQLIMTIPVFVKNLVYWRFTMFKNHLKIAFRNNYRQKVYSLINIAGLVIGLTCTILIMLYVRHELSYDRYHENAENIYRIVRWVKGNPYQGTEWFNSVPGALKAAVAEHFPEVLKSTRAFRRPGIINNNNSPVRENNIFYADPEFLEIFSFPLLYGNQETALNEPFFLLLTEKTSRKYFGNENPLGRILNISNYDYKITGVLKDVPKNSHYSFDFLASFNSLYTFYQGRENIEHWKWDSPWNTYVLLRKGTNPDETSTKMTELFREYRKSKKEVELHLQPLTKIHLHSNINHEIETNSNIQNIYIFSAVAFLIMLIACLNYINLTTARSAKRAKEVGVRKVFGACRNNLFKQFMVESFLFIMVAFGLSLILVFMLLPVFSDFIERDLHFSALIQGEMAFIIICFAVLLGLISGSYPSLFLSSFRPVKIIRGISFIKPGRSLRFRNILVTVQFIISVVLIACSLIIYSQLEYIENKDLGFKKDHIIYGIVSQTLSKNLSPFKEELEKYPDITDVYTSGNLPITIVSFDNPKWEGKLDSEVFHVYSAPVDYNFIDFFEIELIEGRNFSQEYTGDSENAFILNETAVKAIGWENPIGKKFSNWLVRDGRVIGVIKDFHNNSIHLNVEPMALVLTTPKKRSSYYAVKVKSERISDTIEYLKSKFREFSPDYPFRYYFLDERIDSMYRKEQKVGEIFNYFTLIAIFLSCLGLFGLMSFTVTQKTKEIGIRKVLGASVAGLFWKLTTQFFKWIIISNLIALPIAYLAMNQWLQNFAYRTDLGIWKFLLSGLLALLIIIITNSFQSIKAATANPVDSLRYE
ncbi:MAG: ABC transporter permease [Candidatus Aminicenantes bacterium]|nr:MAG: ABC transporter permease [Candidatus Aminicenantes bacterium]